MSAPITTEVITQEAGRLCQGGYRPTPRQLYYAVCGAVEQPPASLASGMIGSGVILIMAACLTLPLRLPPLPAGLAALGIALIVAGGLTRRRERHRPAGPRPLALSYDTFTAGHLAEALAAGCEGLEQLVGAEAAPPNPGPPGEARLVICDRPETAAMLQANSSHLPAGTEVVAEAALGSRGPGLRPAALHDADPRGCELPARLRDAGAAAVTDLGLLPPADDTGLQIIEGAPARLPRDLAGELTAAQMAWLRSGRRLELATRTPEEVVAMVREGFERQSGGVAKPGEGRPSS